MELGGKVVVANLPRTTCDADLQKLCGQIGEIGTILHAMVCITVFSHEYIPIADNIFSFSNPRIGKQDSLVALPSSGISSV